MTHVEIPLSEPSPDLIINGELIISRSSRGLIIFALGSGSGRSSPRNQHVANSLNGFGFATLLIDLLTPQEQESDLRSQRIINKIPGLVLNKFNIRLLSKRLITITKWTIDSISEVTGLPIGYFGARYRGPQLQSRLLCLLSFFDKFPVVVVF